MVMALKMKNKLQFLDGTLPRPDVSDPLFHSWVRCNTLILTWLKCAIFITIGKSIQWIDTAKDVWIAKFQEKVTLFQQGTLNISEYFIELRVLWDEFAMIRPIPSAHLNCACGGITLMRKN